MTLPTFKSATCVPSGKQIILIITLHLTHMHEGFVFPFPDSQLGSSSQFAFHG